MKDGGPAFPGTHLDPEIRKKLRESPALFSAQDASRLASYHGGMSLRDYLAAQALPVFLREMWGEPDCMETAALGSYQVADEMLKVREKGPGQ